ncbi:hypothetical protein QQF64_019538 [Cirrhinus molitorella]|uniref:Uncharacterized protein n=1 Tax=Cirrhinus molitorella TaxID=172907 RepID=A0ABR3LJC0_9TELE
MKEFIVSITTVPDSGLPAAAVAGVVLAALLPVAAVAFGVVYCHRKSRTEVPQNEEDDDNSSDPKTFL